MKSLFLALALVFSAQSAFADFLLEPYLGYHMGTLESKTKAGVTTKASDDGFGIGARAAYNMMGFFFGLDVASINTVNKYSDPANTSDTTGARTPIFVVAGYEPPVIPLRFWLGYALANKLTVSGIGTDTSYSGTTFKLGLGYKLIPILSLNFEYFLNNYTSYSSGGTSGNVSDSFDSFKSSAYMISASVPLIF